VEEFQLRAFQSSSVYLSLTVAIPNGMDGSGPASPSALQSSYLMSNQIHRRRRCFRRVQRTKQSNPVRIGTRERVPGKTVLLVKPVLKTTPHQASNNDRALANELDWDAISVKRIIDFWAASCCHSSLDPGAHSGSMPAGSLHPANGGSWRPRFSAYEGRSTKNPDRP